jgi:hypothetical protein
MSQEIAQARLIRSLAVLNDSLHVTVMRAGQAHDMAEVVSEELADVLGSIHYKLYASWRILDELLAEQQYPPAAP